MPLRLNLREGQSIFVNDNNVDIMINGFFKKFETGELIIFGKQVGVNCGRFEQITSINFLNKIRIEDTIEGAVISVPDDNLIYWYKRGWENLCVHRENLLQLYPANPAPVNSTLATVFAAEMSRHLNAWAANQMTAPSRGRLKTECERWHSETHPGVAFPNKSFEDALDSVENKAKRGGRGPDRAGGRVIKKNAPKNPAKNPKR